jgi:zinc-ribbon domain
MIEGWDDELAAQRKAEAGSGDRFCPSCGAPRVAGARFCASCGHAFVVEPTVAPPPGAPAPLGTVPVDRRAQMSYYRSTVGWSCLGRVMVVGGAILGFVLGLFVGAYPLAGNPLLALLVGFVVGPLVGAGVGWWLWTETWGRR